MKSEFDKEEGDETRAAVGRKRPDGKEQMTTLDRFWGREITARDKTVTKDCGAKQNNRQQKEQMHESNSTAYQEGDAAAIEIDAILGSRAGESKGIHTKSIIMAFRLQVALLTNRLLGGLGIAFIVKIRTYGWKAAHVLFLRVRFFDAGSQYLCLFLRRSKPILLSVRHHVVVSRNVDKLVLLWKLKSWCCGERKKEFRRLVKRSEFKYSEPKLSDDAGRHNLGDSLSSETKFSLKVLQVDAGCEYAVRRVAFEEAGC